MVGYISLIILSLQKFIRQLKIFDFKYDILTYRVNGVILSCWYNIDIQITNINTYFM